MTETSELDRPYPDETGKRSARAYETWSLTTMGCHSAGYTIGYEDALASLSEGTSAPAVSERRNVPGGDSRDGWRTMESAPPENAPLWGWIVPANTPEPYHFAQLVCFEQGHWFSWETGDEIAPPAYWQPAHIPTRPPPPSGGNDAGRVTPHQSAGADTSDDDADYYRPDASGYSRADEEWFFDMDGKP